MELDEAKTAIANYRDHHRKPGGFLMAVLTNNLLGAVGTADESSLRNLKAITLYAYNELPEWAFGSQVKVDTHLAAIPPV